MALTDDQLQAIRSEIGDQEPPDDSDLDDIYARVGTTDAVVAEVLRKRLIELLNAPASFAVDGYQENNAANIAALTKRVETAEERSAGQVTVTRLVRPDRSRSFPRCLR